MEAPVVTTTTTATDAAAAAAAAAAATAITAALKTVEKFDAKSEKLRILMGKEQTESRRNMVYEHRQKLKQRTADLWCSYPPLHKVDFSVDTQTAVSLGLMTRDP